MNTYTKLETDYLEKNDSVNPVTEPFVSLETAFLLGRQQSINDWLTAIPLVLSDALAVTVSVCLLQLSAAVCGWETVSRETSFAVLMVAFTLLVQHIHGLYPACGLPHSLEFRRTLRTSLLVVMALAFGWVMQLPAHTFPLLGFLAFAGLLPLSLVTLRALTRTCLASSSWWTQPVLIVGDGKTAQHAYELLEKSRFEGLRPVGIAFESEQYWRDKEDCSLYIGPAAQLDALLKQSRVCRVMLTNPDAGRAVDFFAYRGIPHVTLPTDLGYHPTERTRLNERSGTIELHCYNAVTAPGAQLAKRMLDIGLIVLAAPFLVPVFAILALMVRISSPGPIFYGSRRVGLRGKVFKAWKFRSMYSNGTELLERHFGEHPEDRQLYSCDHKLKNDPRITPVGKFLRKTSLDELPQIWNVIIGQMSLVGPRPILEDEYVKYGQVYELYMTVPPGITGLWQVSGRNNLEYSERVRYTRFYIQNWSCTLDLYILWRTIRTAISGEGAY